MVLRTLNLIKESSGNLNKIKRISGPYFTSGIISNFDMSFIRFECGNAEDAKFDSCHFKNVEFEGMWMLDINFDNCIFENCRFYDVTGYGLQAKGCTFNNTKFLGVNFSEAVFLDCSFVNVVFSSDNIGTCSDLLGSVFIGSVIDNLVFKCVDTDEKTQLPKKNKKKKNKKKH